MELNFNSVEMSREPRAEASSLDYAEAKLTFNSVEAIPSLNATTERLQRLGVDVIKTCAVNL